MVRGTIAMDAPRSTLMREAELAARWAAGAWRGALLRTISGATYRLIFEGRRNGGPGPDFRDAALISGPTPVIMALRVSGGAISTSRARIMAVNVVVPFAAALAAQIGDAALADRARSTYLALPGLPSNQITREMMRQFGLTRHPTGAAAQQGLHHLWARWRHAKDCARCPCNLRRTAPKTL